VALEKVMDAVFEFMTAAGRKPATTPGFPEDMEVRRLRLRLLREEYEEYLSAESDSDIVKISDALADMAYIIAETAHTYGIPLAAIFNEVQRSNMAKFPNGVATFRADGKILKPEGWKPPDLVGILREHGAQI
jgi:predicted HAD superfamily Cof-like phosphohydrolase